MTKDYEERVETLCLFLGGAMGWMTDTAMWEAKLKLMQPRVEALGAHGTEQAVSLIEGHPDGALREAAYTFISEGKTDRLAFLGVEVWAHHSILKTVRTLDGSRYDYEDFLQAPEHVLKEARTLADITNLCLSGELSHGIDNTRETGANGKLEYTLNNDALVKLVQRYPETGNEIMRAMRLKNTLDASLIEQVMTTTTPLVNGVL